MSLTLRLQNGFVALDGLTKGPDLKEQVERKLASLNARVMPGLLSQIVKEIEAKGFSGKDTLLEFPTVPAQPLSKDLKLALPQSMPTLGRTEESPFSKSPKLGKTEKEDANAMGRDHQRRTGQLAPTIAKEGFVGAVGFPKSELCNPKNSMKALVKTDFNDGIQVKQGGAEVQVMPWPDSQGRGFSLLIDVYHNDQKTPGEWVDLKISIPFQDHGVTKYKPLPISAKLVPTNHHTQVLYNISEKDLLVAAPWVTNLHEIAIQPIYSNDKAKAFHETAPVCVPIMISKGSDTGVARKVFDPVPINRSLTLPSDVVNTHSLLAPGTKVTTNMETEAEFTLSGPDAESDLEHMVMKIDDLSRDPVLLAKVLGEGWTCKRVTKYDMVGADNKFTQNPDNFKRWTQTDCDKYGVGKERPGLQERGIARPGMIHDEYLFEQDGKVLRTRSNARESNLLASKGRHVRSKDGLCMTRYCRQVPLNDNPVGDKNSALTKLVGDEVVGFTDVFGKAVKPSAEPILKVDSERYRYKFTFTKSIPNVEIELSADFSTGTDGTKTVKSFGFELGLDHAGASSDVTSTSTPSKGLSGPQKPGSMSHKVTGPVEHLPVRDRVHDDHDLDHESIMKGPTFDVFNGMVRQVADFLSDGKKLTLAGEKAKVMLESMK